MVINTSNLYTVLYSLFLDLRALIIIWIDNYYGPYFTEHMTEIKIFSKLPDVLLLVSSWFMDPEYFLHLPEKHPLSFHGLPKTIKE